MNSPSEMLDKDLIKGCANNDRLAQQRLYNKYSTKMFGVCLRFAKNYHSAEDLLQVGFIKVFTNIKSFRGDGSFEGWLRRIFVNTGIEHYRKSNPLYSINDAKEDFSRRIDNEAINNLAAEDVLHCVNQLSDGYRTVFNLYVMEGYTHKEIGELLGINEGTSKSQLARARYILQETIVKHYEVRHAALVQ